jgi:hypothetical protein
MRFSRHRGRGLRAGGLLAACLLTAAAVQARGGPPTGVIAVSAGSRVSVVDPATGKAARFETGPVGWLYPGPGGRLFAPDLVHGKTVVIDLHRRRVVETLSGVTMPRFDREVPDRYLEVAGDVFVFSFPERALLAKVPAKITRPWQVAVSRDWTTILVLERTPGSGAPPVSGRWTCRPGRSSAAPRSRPASPPWPPPCASASWPWPTAAAGSFSSIRAPWA